MIAATYVHSGPTYDPTRTTSGTPRVLTTLQRQVERSLARPGSSVMSRSGLSAIFAINFLETNGVPYSLKAVPGKGYVIARDLDENGEKL
jgi:hypothetical protein